MSYTSSGPNEIVKVNYDATTDPTTGNDETEAYSVGSRWVNTVSDTDFVCLNPATGSAVWLPTTGGGGGLGQWDYVTGGGAPAVTKITANTDLMSTVTTINIADASGTDNNFSASFGAVRAGDYLIIRDNAGGAAFGSFLITAAPVDNTTYWTFTVSTGDVSGSFTDTNTYDVNLISDGNVVGPAASTTNALVRYSSATGRAIKSLSTATLTDTTALLLSGTQAEAQLQQRTTGSTPTANHGTYWVKDDAPTTPMFTDDTDVDHKLTQNVLTFQLTFNPAVVDRWIIWTDGGPWDGNQLQATSGGTGALPSFTATWEDAPIHMPDAVTIDSVDVSWGPAAAPASAPTLEFMLAKYPLTDGMTAATTVTDVASASDTGTTSLDLNLLALTVNAGTINANDGLRFQMRVTAGDMDVNYRCNVTIKYG